MRRNDWKHERETSSQSTLREAIILLAGIGIGSAFALLLAPASGEDLRHAIDRRYRKTVKHIGRHREDLADRAEDFLDRVYELRDRGSKILEPSRSGYLRKRRA